MLMTEKTISHIIRALNKPNPKFFIAEQPIGFDVHFGLVWIDLDFKKTGNHEPKKFYFIGDGRGKFVGADYNMVGGLHWYIEPKSRKKGYLSKALKSVILPHLALSGAKQEISIDREVIREKNYQDSLNVALKAGFRIKRGTDRPTICIQDLKPYKKVPLALTLIGMDWERLTILRQEMSE
jgi:hypothetical protein